MPRWKKIQPGDVNQMAERVKEESIRKRVWPAIAENHQFVEYKLGNAQEASTYVTWKGPEEPYSTADQMHSEMVAVGAMLQQGAWQLAADGRVRGAADDDGPITVANFRTGVPHCRFCTVMLHLLGLPIAERRATKGNYKKAAELEYRLPEPVRNSPVVLGRLLEGYAPPHHRADSLVAVKRRFDALVRKPAPEDWVLGVGNEYVATDGVRQQAGGAEVLGWGAVSGHEMDVDAPDYGQVTAGRLLWKVGFDGLYRAEA